MVINDPDLHNEVAEYQNKTLAKWLKRNSDKIKDIEQRLEKLERILSSPEFKMAQETYMFKEEDNDEVEE